MKKGFTFSFRPIRGAKGNGVLGTLKINPKLSPTGSLNCSSDLALKAKSLFFGAESRCPHLPLSSGVMWARVNLDKRVRTDHPLRRIKQPLGTFVRQHGGSPVTGPSLSSDRNQLPRRNRAICRVRFSRSTSGSEPRL